MFLDEKKKAKAIKDIILWNIRYLFDNYYKPIRESNFWSENYIEYESNGDMNETISVEDILIKLDHI